MVMIPSFQLGDRGSIPRRVNSSLQHISFNNIFLKYNNIILFIGFLVFPFKIILAQEHVKLITLFLTALIFFVLKKNQEYAKARIAQLVRAPYL